MIFWIGKLLAPFHAFSFLRLAEYLSSRSIGAALTAVLLTLWITPKVIWWLQRRAFVDQVRETGIPSAFDKAGTPVMGGVVLVGVVAFSCLLWCNLGSGFSLLVLFGMVWFGAIGFVDDRAKMMAKSGDKGMSEPKKLLLQGAFAAVLVAVLASPLSPVPAHEASQLYLPFLKSSVLDNPWIYFPFVFVFVLLVGNSVNITDGMDGLAIVPSVFAISVLGVFGYLLGNAIWSRYLFYPLLPGAGELAVFASAFAGAGIGFLWFNAYPAQIFMGDTGSLSIGGSLAVASVLLKQEALFVILGGLFVAEAFSSQVQDKIGIKLLGRRLFARAPLHHAMAYNGLAETKVVVRLWIVAGILALAALATLKLR
ncbi:MAG: phospho-N-acetylmuramoyl-pentapeptide-transferase [Holophagales bacterium]|nr:phospho-N-acetylmuramoyl-pentapeptide-transferase [Holophagales bacterium]